MVSVNLFRTLTTPQRTKWKPLIDEEGAIMDLHYALADCHELFLRFIQSQRLTLLAKDTLIIRLF
jgi:hypothetical protein